MTQAGGRTFEEKLAILNGFTEEAEFRTEVLLPLLRRMFDSAWHTHGSDERGRDFVCRCMMVFGAPCYVAVVAKVGLITGKVSGATSLQTVVNQVKESFSYPYEDPESRSPVFMNMVLVITNGEVTAAARTKLGELLRRQEGANTYFVSATQLVRLLDKYLPDAWSKYDDRSTGVTVMTQDASKVLYLIAGVARGRKRERKHMSRKELAVRTSLPQQRLDGALDYLLGEGYIKKARRDSFVIDPEETEPTLATNPDDIRVLLAAKDISNSAGRFTVQELAKACTKRPYRFRREFVLKSMKRLIRMGYVEKDIARGEGHYTLEQMTAEEEKDYWCLVDKYGWRSQGLEGEDRR